jgi:peptidoglycan-associated lipoprotein
MMRGLVVGMAVAGLVMAGAGCAKKPATTGATVPAPTAPPASARAAEPRPVATAATPPASTAPARSAAVAARPAPSEFRAHSALGDVHFEFDKAEIRPTETKILDANATWLRANAGAVILIEGHADERGTNEYNVALGDRRAQVTRQYLMSQGVPAARFHTISYGEERPTCGEHAEACWTQNRRAHFLVKMP